MSGWSSKDVLLPYNRRHSIILSAKCNFFKMFVRHILVKYYFSKAIIFTYIQNMFWIIGGCNNTIKRIIRACTLCTWLKAVIGRQLMAHPPETQSTTSRSLTNVGIDFTGHYLIKCLSHRSYKLNEVYGAFFIHFASRVVHLEIVSDLTAEKFIESLYHLASHRGLPKCIFSDNGKNFVGINDLLYQHRAHVSQKAAD